MFEELKIIPNFEERKAKTTLDKKNWIAYMKKMNYWCSFYAFLYRETTEKIFSLIIPPISLFPDKIVKITFMSNKVTKSYYRAQ